MEIRTNTSPPNLVPFSSLKPGETFTTGNALHMRVTSKADVPANAVVLADGRLYNFGPDDEVTPVKAYVVKETV